MFTLAVVFGVISTTYCKDKLKSINFKNIFLIAYFKITFQSVYLNLFFVFLFCNFLHFLTCSKDRIEVPETITVTSSFAVTPVYCYHFLK